MKQSYQTRIILSSVLPKKGAFFWYFSRFFFAPPKTGLKSGEYRHEPLRGRKPAGVSSLLGPYSVLEKSAKGGQSAKDDTGLGRG
jgi:hypothetical protein